MSSRKKGRKCSMKYCDSFQHTHNHLSFFRFPKDPERSKLWIENSSRPDLIEKISVHEDRVCELHFENHMFISNYRNRLQAHAVPVLYLNGPPPPRPMIPPTTGRQMMSQQHQQQQLSSLQPPSQIQPQLQPQPPTKRRHVEHQSMELFKKYETNDDLLTVMDVQEIHDFQRRPARSATMEQAYMEAAAEIRKTGASFRKAAEKFGVNYVTLRRYCARISKPQNMSHQNLDNPHNIQHQQQNNQHHQQQNNQHHQQNNQHQQQNNQHQQPNNHYQLNRQQQRQQQQQQQRHQQQQQQQPRKILSKNQLLNPQQQILQQRQLLQQQQLQKQLYLQSLTKNLSPSTSLTATPLLNMTNNDNDDNNHNHNHNNYGNNIYMNSQNSISLLQGNHLKNTNTLSLPSPSSTSPTASPITITHATAAAAAAATPTASSSSSSSSAAAAAAAASYKRPRQIFSVEQEEELAGYVQDTSNYYNGLSSKDVRTLAFVYALCNQVEIPPGWRETYQASFDWCLGFIKRNKLASMIVTGHSAYKNNNNNGGVPYPSSIAGVALTPSSTSKMHIDNGSPSKSGTTPTTNGNGLSKSILPEVSPILNNHHNTKHHKSLLNNESQNNHNNNNIIETIEL